MACRHCSLGIAKELARLSGLSLFLVCASLAMAQFYTGTLSGTVTDQTGAAVPGEPVQFGLKFIF